MARAAGTADDPGMTATVSHPAPVLADPPAPPAEALAHFAARLAFECDPADVVADLRDGGGAFVLLDCRSRAAYARAHLPGARSLPHAEIDAAALDSVPAGTLLVTYCWGPGCNGATRAALALALLGFRVREMIGGFEYWAREGLPVETADGVHRPDADPLTAPVELSCGC